MRETIGERLIAPVEICPIGETCSAVRAEAENALYGDRTCSVPNMSTTCFAAEHCALCDGRNPTFPDSFDARSSVTLVAHTARAADRMESTDSDRFVGCACIAPASVYPRSWYPYNFDGTDVQVIYNLCVASEFQGGGIGRQLVAAARNHVAGRPLYLFVLKTGTESRVREIASEMQRRVQRLDTTYRRMGLKPIADMGNVLLFQVA